MSRSYRRQRGLSPVQYEAIRLALHERKNQSDIARTLGLSRPTVSRWLNHDWTFISELNTQQNEMLAAERRQRIVLRRKAIDALHAGIDAGDTKLALRVYEILEKGRREVSTAEHPDAVGEDQAMDILWRASKKAGRGDEIKKFVREHLEFFGDLQARWERQLEGATESLESAAAVVGTDPAELVKLVEEIYMGLVEVEEAFGFSEGEGLRALATTSVRQQEEFFRVAQEALGEASSLCWDDEANDLVWKGPEVMAEVAHELARAAGVLLDAVDGAQGRPSFQVAPHRSVESELASARASLGAHPITAKSKPTIDRVQRRLHAIAEAGLHLTGAMELSMFVEDDDHPAEETSP